MEQETLHLMKPRGRGVGRILEGTNQNCSGTNCDKIDPLSLLPAEGAILFRGEGVILFGYCPLDPSHASTLDEAMKKA